MLTAENSSPNVHSRLTLQQLNGIFVLDKPSGPTSAQCLRVIKRLGQKKLGHAGTLDPMASGVLLVLLGHATKISSYLMEGGKKIYRGQLRLGLETDTWDIQGNIIAEKDWSHIRADAISGEISAWPRLTEQEIPAFSAAKHNGQPLYRLARKGVNAPAKIKPVTIFHADVLAVNMPFVEFRVACGSGAYIRSLAHSLGKRLGCGAALSALTREYSHPFGLDQARKLEDLENDPGILASHLQPVCAALPDWPQIDLSPEQASDARNGKAIAAPASSWSRAILCENNIPLALAHFSGYAWNITRGLWS